MPKAKLEASPDLAFELYLAKELHMTHRQLLGSLGVGEIALWRAQLEIEYEARERARKRAEREANQTRG